MEKATEEDWSAEYLAPILAVRLVDDLEQAHRPTSAPMDSHHTDAIVAEDEAAAALPSLAAGVDSAIVLINASTQFADGARNSASAARSASPLAGYMRAAPSARNN